MSRRQKVGGLLAVAVGGMVLPMVLGITLGLLFLPASDFRMAQALFVGTALAITAVPATVKILIDLGRLDTPPGQIIVSAAVFDDVLSLLLLARVGFDGVDGFTGPFLGSSQLLRTAGL